MIRCSILYPNRTGAHFDSTYYLERHIPWVTELLSRHPSFRGTVVEQGISGLTPESPPAYLAMCHFTFETIEAYFAAFLPHAEGVRGDLVNYTDVTPVVQFSRVAVPPGASLLDCR